MLDVRRSLSLGRLRFIDHQANDGAEDKPLSILSKMLLKTLATAQPQLTRGEPYSSEDIAFFWAMAKQHANELPAGIRESIVRHKPSWRLRKDLTNIFNCRGVFTLTGRLRAKAPFCARRNTVFQGLAADGAKLALWRLWRKGYTIHNFIHDEVLISVPITDHVAKHEKTIRRIMVKAMQEVVPDVKIGVESRVMSNWSKSEGNNMLPPSRKRKVLVIHSGRKKRRIVLHARP